LDTTHYNGELYVNNVTNSHGLYDYDNQGGVNQTGLASFIQPRTIGIEVGAKF